MWAAAVEIASHRVSAVSPAVFTESLAGCGACFPGMPSAGLAGVAQAYIRSAGGAQAGQACAR